MFRFMGFFLQRLSAAGGPGKGSNMVALDNEAALADCLASSGEEPVFVFKHSTRCPISTAAHREVQAYTQRGSDAALPVYMNLVVEDRAVSNAIAERLGVRHESPQILLVSKGQVVWHTSHGSIRADALARAAGQVAG